jgi:hypothetical protein
MHAGLVGYELRRLAKMVPRRTQYSRSLLKVPFAHVIVG